jgi:hypothetical protein
MDFKFCKCLLGLLTPHVIFGGTKSFETANLDHKFQTPVLRLDECAGGTQKNIN